MVGIIAWARPLLVAVDDELDVLGVALALLTSRSMYALFISKVTFCVA